MPLEFGRRRRLMYALINKLFSCKLFSLKWIEMLIISYLDVEVGEKTKEHQRMEAKDAEENLRIIAVVVQSLSTVIKH